MIRPDNDLLQSANKREHPRSTLWVDCITLLLIGLYLAGYLLLSGCEHMQVCTNLNWTECREFQRD